MFFFDTTPIGRIVNRFSADIETIDNELPWTVQMFWDTAFMVVATFVVISYGTPLFMTVIIPFAFFYFVAQVSLPILELVLNNLFTFENLSRH